MQNSRLDLRFGPPDLLAEFGSRGYKDNHGSLAIAESAMSILVG
jgi:hypothetical protein